jgi:hypothetical protein
MPKRKILDERRGGERGIVEYAVSQTCGRTKIQRDIHALLKKGRSFAEIAIACGISERRAKKLATCVLVPKSSPWNWKNTY